MSFIFLLCNLNINSFWWPDVRHVKEYTYMHRYINIQVYVCFLKMCSMKPFFFYWQPAFLLDDQTFWSFSFYKMTANYFVSSSQFGSDNCYHLFPNYSLFSAYCVFLLSFYVERANQYNRHSNQTSIGVCVFAEESWEAFTSPNPVFSSIYL